MRLKSGKCLLEYTRVLDTNANRCSRLSDLGSPQSREEEAWSPQGQKEACLGQALSVSASLLYRICTYMNARHICQSHRIAVPNQLVKVAMLPVAIRSANCRCYNYSVRYMLSLHPWSWRSSFAAFLIATRPKAYQLLFYLKRLQVSSGLSPHLPRSRAARSQNSGIQTSTPTVLPERPVEACFRKRASLRI